jgi:phage shock protein PspC (stress-responsive transcriptional regulator)
MQRVITATLNHTAYPFEEDAHARLAAYLAEAARTLAGNPDRDEILADLEQAIADQCKRRLGLREGPFTLRELLPALDEIGRVQVPGADAPRDQSAGAGNRPIEQVSEGAWISGVCLGLARYLGIDVTLLRVVAFVLLLVSGGSMVLVYVVLMLLLPFAPLDSTRGTVGTIPLKARQLVQALRGKLGVPA